MSASALDLECRGWQQEAALRMLRNNLHPDVAENPAELVVYGGIGKAARNWASYHTIERELKRLGDDADAARPVGQAGRRVRHPRSRAAGADRQLEPGPAMGQLGDVPRARRRRADDVRPDDRRLVDLHRHPRASCRAPTRRSPRPRASGSAATLAGRLVVTAGLGGMGGAQPLAITMLGGAALCIEVDLQRIERRIQTGYLDERAGRPRRRAGPSGQAARASGAALSIGLAGNAAEIAARARAPRRARSTSSPTRPAPTTRSTATSRPG